MHGIDDRTAGSRERDAVYSSSPMKPGAPAPLPAKSSTGNSPARVPALPETARGFMVSMREIFGRILSPSEGERETAAEFSVSPVFLIPMPAELLDQPQKTRPGEELDAGKLEAWLRQALPDLSGQLEIAQFPKGYSNLT